MGFAFVQFWCRLVSCCIWFSSLVLIHSESWSCLGTRWSWSSLGLCSGGLDCSLYIHVSAVASWSAEPAKQKKKKTKCAQDAALSPSWLKDSWKVSVLLCTWNHHHAELRREPIKTRIFSQWSRHYKIIGYKGFFSLPLPLLKVCSFIWGQNGKNKTKKKISTSAF